MNNEPLHDAITSRIIELYEQGNELFDISTDWMVV